MVVFPEQLAPHDGVEAGMPRPIAPTRLLPLTLLTTFLLAACAQEAVAPTPPARPARLDAAVLPAKPTASFVLRSSELTPGAPMPKEFTGDGAGVTPSLE